MKMDCRRLESAHLRFAALKVCSKYGAVRSLSANTVHADIQQTLAKITPMFFTVFRSTYAGTYMYDSIT